MATPTFDEILSQSISEAQAAQFLAEQQHARDVEWRKKHGQNPMELFGNCQ